MPEFNRLNLVTFVVAIIIGSLAGSIIATSVSTNRTMHKVVSFEHMDEHRQEFITARHDIQQEMMDHGDYACCLEQPCIYCIEKSPGHGEGAACHCLEDVINGIHPCGECIGEIMEGHGNKFLSKHFASAIAEKVGFSHLDSLKLMIQDMYGIPVEDQI
jgi:hypothetical protein